MGKPRSATCDRTSFCALPIDATLLKIPPISSISEPVADAELATDFRTPSSSLPGLMPAATAPAAVVAASPRPKDVPLTEARALSIIASTSLASLPRPFSFACAVSIPVRRPRPLVIEPASAPPAATPTPATPALSVLPMPLEILEPMELPTSEPYPETPFKDFLICPGSFDVSATMEICPTANSAMIYPRRIVKLGRGKTQPFVHLFDRNRVHLESVSVAKQCGAIVSRRFRSRLFAGARHWRRPFPTPP